MPKITFIGAGSCVFTKNLLGDILQFPELASSEIALMDIDEGRLKVAEVLAHKVADALKVKPEIRAYTDRKKAIDGANYVINTIQVGGYEPSTAIDFEIPKKYGLRQTIADTLGIGGIMRGLRTIPVMVSSVGRWRNSAPTPGFSTTRTRWQSTPAPFCSRQRKNRRPLPRHSGLSSLARSLPGNPTRGAHIQGRRDQPLLVVRDLGAQRRGCLSQAQTNGRGGRGFCQSRSCSL